MFCKNCGTQLDDEDKYCASCGMLIKNNHSESVKQDEEISISSETVNSTDTEAIETSESDMDHHLQTQTKEDSKKKLIIAMIIAVVVIVVGLLLISILGNGSSDSNIYHETNFNNGANFAYDNNRLYLVDLLNEDDEDTVLYSMDYDGSNRTVISNDSDIQKIRIVDDKIFYETEGDDVVIIGMMNKDGSENTTIVTSSEYIDHYDVYKDILYYVEDNSIHTCSVKGEDNKVIIHSATTFTLCNGYIYYVDSSDTIHSYRIKDGDTKELCKSSGVHSLSVDGNTLYFACDSGLNSIMTNGDGTITNIVMDSELGNYVFYNEQLYYQHLLSIETIEEFAKEWADDETEESTYKLALAATGLLYKADLSNGEREKVESNTSLVYSLYSYPKGMYYQFFLWKDDIEPLNIINDK